MIVIYAWQSQIRKRRKCIRYLSYGLFTVNPVKVNVIHLHTLLCISVSRLPSNFIGIITMSSHFFEIACSVALSFLKTISCCFGSPSYFIGIYQKLIFLLAVNNVILPLTRHFLILTLGE